MTHQEAVESQAAERYLLGEMPELERFQFEEHYFDCFECADSVKAGAHLAAGVRSAFAEPAPQAYLKPDIARRRRWFQMPVWAPSLAAAALLCVAAYQGLVVLPGLRHNLEARSLTPALVRSASRGEPAVVGLEPGAPFVLLAAETDMARPGERLSYTLRETAGPEVASGTAVGPAPGFPLLLLIPSHSVRAGHDYLLELRELPPAAGRAEFPFRVQLH
jgi:hypothetical protein